jgi:nitrate reductase beta subunit
LTAGDEAPVKLALKRLLAMRVYKRSQQVDGVENLAVLEEVGLTRALAEDMYRYLAIANYEDRFVIPTAHREEALSEVFAERNGCGFSFGSGCSGSSDTNMFGGKKANRRDVLKTVQLWEE